MTRKSSAVRTASPSQGAVAVSLLLLAVNAAPPYQSGPRETMLLLLVAGVLLEMLSRSPSGLRLGSGWHALAWATGYPGLGAPWLLTISLLVQTGISQARTRKPQQATTALEQILPALAAVAVFHFLPARKAAVVAVIVFLGLCLALHPIERKEGVLRRAAEELLWFAAVLWASTHGIWALMGALVALVALYCWQESPDNELRSSLSRQMLTTESTLRASQQRFKEDKGRYQELLSAAGRLDDFQLRALQVDSERALCDLLIEAVAALDPDCQAAVFLIREGRPDRKILATHDFRLTDFEPLPAGWQSGQASRSSCGTRSLYPLNAQLIFLRRSVDQKTQEQRDRTDEVLDQLLGRARLIVRILEQKRELAGLVSDKTRALHQLAESQSQLLQSEKLASIGQLAAGVAHEINSPLAAIQLQAQLARKRLGKNDSEGVIRSLDTCVMASKRAKAIIESLLTFAQFSDGTREPVLLSEVLAQSMQMLEGHFESAAVDVRTRLPQLPVIQANAQEIGQILTNILTNAVDALTERPDGRRIMVSAVLQGNTQNLTVANNGPAIPEGVMEKLFDPFFTTKETGKGTGLGLSLAYQLARGHGGSITPANQNGWVHFTLTLPGTESQPGQQG